MTKKLSLVEIEYICNMFFQYFEIPVCFLDCNKNILIEFTSKNDSHSWYASNIEQLHVLLQKNDSYNFPIFRTHQHLGHFILIHIKSDYMVNGTVIIGPLTHVNFSTSKTDSNLNFISNYKKTINHYFSLSIKDQNFFVNIAILFYNILYKKNSDVSTFSNNSDSFHISHSRILNEDIYFSMQKDESICHNLYIEQQLLGAIENGDKETVLKYYYEFQQETLSSLSSFHQLRRHKNICISSITLATRYAIKGGLPSGIAYKIYDLYTQKTEDLKDIESVWDLLRNVFCSFADRVKEQKVQQHSKTIAICKNYIFKNIYNQISVKQIAKFANVNSDYLSILFKKEVGISLIEYIQRERIEEAKKLLTFTTYPLSDICASLNFSDQSYFTKIFKKFTNETPGKYRQSHVVI
ncbi:AraC family transcriptional regulator [Bacillus fungorum]|uniref:AraC family transcriptional regulator n=1 Tax=Bacillus fungorum TaxID=2039284 RepID=A0A2G6QA01_9BACI|nr:helix-turn-helix domain-containing protein [Bacillus fungorum]PIE93605.1 AraC family transcriptional regulator [Bacillus fungorum]